MIDQKRHPFYGAGRDAEAELFVAWDGRDKGKRIIQKSRASLARYWLRSKIWLHVRL